MSAIPKRRKHVANAPIRKYFNAASFEDKEDLLLPASIYIEMESISIPRKSIIILLNDVMITPPISEKIINTK